MIVSLYIIYITSALEKSNVLDSVLSINSAYASMYVIGVTNIESRVVVLLLVEFI